MSDQKEEYAIKCASMIVILIMPVCDSVHDSVCIRVWYNCGACISVQR